MTNDTMPRVQHKIEVDNMEQIITLFGSFDENAIIIEQETGATITTRDRSICIDGAIQEADLARIVLEKLLGLLNRREPIDKNRIRYAIDLAREGNAELLDELSGDVVAFTHRGRQIKCKTIGQKRYIKAIKENTVVLSIGPAGTGKTYLAVAMAVLAFKNKEVDKIILTRPAVEAGEKLGFLPGDLQNKVDPYLRPLTDALYDFFGAETYKQLNERGAIEIAPLAYMRGRTLSDAFIILDEAQNTTIEQMKMFLTRFGSGSKVVVTGDVTQIDLPRDKRSGLIHAVSVLRSIDGLEIIQLSHKDVVRHEMVQKIIMAYERAERHKDHSGGET